MNPFLIFIILTVGLATSGSLLLVYFLVFSPRKVITKRLATLTSDSSQSTAYLPKLVKSEEMSEIPYLNRVLNSFRISMNTRRLLESADIKLNVSQFYLISCISGGIGSMLIISRGTGALVFLSFIIFSSVPLLYVKNKKNKRIRKFEQQFPDALDITRNAIQAGFAPSRAIQLVGREMEDPVGFEFRRTADEINLGIPLKDALVNMSQRMDSTDLRLFVTALLIQRESGGNLNEILHKISSTIRARFKLSGQVRIYTAQGKMSQYILGSLPFFFGLMVSVFNPEYLSVLFTTPAGKKLLITAIMMQIAGFLIIKKITRIKLQ